MELSIRIKEKGTKGMESYNYKNDIALNDYKKLALLFLDLNNYGASVEKAFEEYKRLKQESFPW
jgi:hypothetical protein